MNELPSLFCGICRTRLIHVQIPDGEEAWIHSGANGADHWPIPIPEPEDAKYRCDFCALPNAQWIVPIKPFQFTGRSLTHSSEGDWAACWICTALVVADQWWDLLRRCARSWEGRHGFPMDAEKRAVSWEFFQAARSHLSGPVRKR